MRAAEDDPARSRRVREIIESIAERPPHEWRDAARAAAGGDDSIVDEVMALLADADRPSAAIGGAMLQTAATRPVGGLAAPPIDERLRDVPTVRGLPVLGRYVLHRLVGKGGFGSVYRGCHVLLGSEVAVKILSAEVAAHAEVDTRFEREARLGASLKSEHLVQVLDLDRYNELLYLVMEWVDGEDLFSRIERLGPRPWREAAVLLLGLAKGLREVHENDVVHRDVKPANTMLTRTGVVKLADLGLARHTLDSQLQLSAQGVGTPAYMAPEQFDSLHEAGAAADVFSFGATAWHLLTGSPPPRLRGAELRERLQGRVELPAEFAELVLQCLAEAPAERPADGAALVAALQSFCAEHQLPERVAATDLQLDAVADEGLPAAERTAIRREWERTRGDDARAPAPTSAPASSGARAKLTAAVVVLVAAIVAIWALSRDRDDATDATSRANATNAERDESPPPTATPTSTSTSTPTPTLTPPALRLRALQLGDGPQRDVAAERATTFTLPARRFDEPLPATTLTCSWTRPPTARDRVDVTGAATWNEGTPEQLQLALRFGPNDVTVRVGETGDVYTITIEQPCLPAFMAGREFGAADGRTKAFLPVRVPGRAAGADDDLRFVYATDALLVGATEVPRRAFAAFLTAGALAQYVAGDTAYAEWIARIGGGYSIQKRAGELLEGLVDGRGDVIAPELPMCDVHVSEAVAFARWLSAELPGIELRLPTTSEWRRIANQNGNRPADTVGELPFADPATKANCRAGAIGTPTVNPELGAFGKVVDVWSLRQGQLWLYHLGGNVAEFCVDTYNGFTPVSGCIRGGSFDDPATSMRVPDDATGRWQTPPEPSTKVGLRLVATSASTRK